MAKYYVAVAGNIGVGKSTLTTLLARRLGWAPYLEAVAENPYLAEFYQDMPRWSFQSQTFFLARRLRQHHEVLECPQSVLQDRSVYEDAEIFARNLYRQGSMSDRDWQTYYDLYTVLCALVKPPNLVVYLRADVPTLVRRIARRGREYERSLSTSYLAMLNELYDDWASRFTLCPVLTVVTDDLDYVQHDEHLDLIAERILERLQGREYLVLSPD